MQITKKEYKNLLKEELKFYQASKIVYFFQASEKAILRKHQILLRKSEYYTNANKKILATITRFRLSKLQNKYAIHIAPNTCGKGLKIMHIGPILINSNARLGENVALHINTAIVAGGVDSKAPTLGNGVVMGVGSVALGGITIADNVAVGANSVVTKDVKEENIAVAGAPAKKVSDNGRLNWNKESKKKLQR